MPRTEKHTQIREDEEPEYGRAEAPDVDEWEPDERDAVKYSDERVIDFDEDDLAEDIDLDDMFAMEGPDA